MYDITQSILAPTELGHPVFWADSQGARWSGSAIDGYKRDDDGRASQVGCTGRERGRPKITFALTRGFGFGGLPKLTARKVVRVFILTSHRRGSLEHRQRRTGVCRVTERSVAHHRRVGRKEREDLSLQRRLGRQREVPEDQTSQGVAVVRRKP